MSTLTVSAPITAPRGVRRPAAIGRQAGHAVPVRRRGSVPASASEDQASRGPLRLTRRGRLVLLTLLLGLCVLASLVATSSGAASTASQQVPVQYLTVAPGDTLWSIAGEVAPHADPRDTVDEIRELNALTGSTLQVGQRIAVPLQR